MRSLLVLFTIFFSGTIFGQLRMASCEDGIKSANTDFSNKVYTLQTLGQAVDKDFDPVLIAYAKQQYNIQITNSNCVVWPETECYFKIMRTRVLEKFGAGIEARMKAEALQVFKKTDVYLTEIKPKIDTGFVFNGGHTPAVYPGDRLGFRAFLCNNIKETKMGYWTAYVSFIVEKDGSVSNLIFTKEMTQEIQSEVGRLFLLMEKWTPATFYGEKIRVKESHSITSKKNMELMENIRQKKDAEWREKQSSTKPKK